jgi:hypothetical protein
MLPMRKTRRWPHLGEVLSPLTTTLVLLQASGCAEVRRIVLASEVADMHADPTACHTAGFIWRGSDETTRPGCYHQRVERLTGEARTPDDHHCAACVARQGVWRRDGILQRLQCTTIFPDANRLCTSASDCEGRSCFERHRRWPDHGVERYGSCVPRAPFFGCYSQFGSGGGGVCVD